MASQRVDLELVRRAQQGDRGALDLVVASTYAQVYRLALTVSANQADAEDLTQETYARAVRSLQSFRGDSAFETWLWSIGLNVARSRWRRPDPVPTEPTDQAGGDDPADVVEHADGLRQLAEALAALSEQSREIIVLRDIQGLSNQEAAAACAITPTAAKVRLFRAREQLAALLDPTADPSRRRR